MAQETEDIKLGDGDAGSGEFIAIYDANTVFDFNDDTFKANHAACTTPFLAATERTNLGGTSRSYFAVDAFDWGRVHQGCLEKEVLVRKYRTAAPGSPPAATDNPVDGGNPLVRILRFGYRVDRPNRELRLVREPNITSTQGYAVAERCWIQLGEIKVPIEDMDAAATLAVAYHETAAGVGVTHDSIAAATVRSDHEFHLAEDTDPSEYFNANRSYRARFTLNYLSQTLDFDDVHVNF